MGRIVVIILCLLVCSAASSRERTHDEIRSLACEAIAALNTAARSASFNAAELQLLDERDQTEVWGTEGAGFAVVSKSTEFRAILGVAEGSFSADSLPCGLNWWLSEMNRALSSKAASSITSPTLATSDEEDYYFVTTTWRQGSPFNSLCPKIGTASTVTGCLPLALSQVLNYYEYPSQGTGTGSYTLGDTTYTDLDISATYDWDNMLDSYTSGYTDEQATAVATLLFDAAKGTATDFGTSASGAVASSAVEAAKLNFGYDSLALSFLYRMFYADDEWMDLVYNELAQENPIIYCGVDDDEGGHAFVLDGVRSDGLVHVNWGWAGSYNGWFAIDELTPGDRYDFSDDQSLISGFRAHSTPDDDEENTSLWGIQGDFEITISTRGRVSLTVDVSSMFNLCHRYFDGDIELVFCDTLGNETRYTFYSGDMPAYYGWERAAVSYDISRLSKGTYLLYLTSCNRGETTPQPVRSLGGVEYYTLVVGSRNSYTLSEGDLTAVHAATAASAGEPTTYYDLRGRLLPSQEAAGRGIVVMKQGQTTKKILLTN